MRVGEAVAALDVAEPEGQDLIIVRFEGGKARHFTLQQAAGWDLDRDLYIASGAFERGTVGEWKGREFANVRSILWLPFDCDLSDWLACPKADLHALDDDTLMRHVAAQRGDVERVFARLDLPIHRLDYTGYGLCAYVRIAPDLAAATGLLKSLHKRLVRQINQAWGGKLVNPQASDAGTRVTRVPGCLNTKGPIPRRSRVLSSAPGALGEAQARALARDLAPEPTPIRAAEPNPEPSKDLSRADADAIAAALAPHWTEGARHALALGLSGMLAKAGVSEAQTEALMGVLAADDAEAGDRLTAVRTTYTNLAAGGELLGYTKLAEAAGPALADYVDGVLAPYRQAGSPRLLRAELPAQRAEPPAQRAEPPAQCFRGLFGAYRDLMAPTTEAADAFHLATILTITGALLGRGACVDYGGGDVFGNLFVCLVGPTGRARKDTAMSRGLKFAAAVPAGGRALRAGGAGFGLSFDAVSAEGVVDTLRDEGPAVLWYMTEFSILLRRAQRQSTNTLLTMFTKLWDCPDFVETPGRTAKVRVEEPFAAILTATTPEALANDMTQEEIGSGFANRFLFFRGDGKQPGLPRPPRVRPDELARLAAELRGALRTYEGRTAPLTLPVLPAAEERWDDWYQRNHAAKWRHEGEAQMSERLAVNIHKAALLYAASEGQAAVHDAHLAAAIALVDWCFADTRRRIDTWGEERDAKVQRRILHILGSRGAMTPKKLQQSIGYGLGPGNFKRILDAMQGLRLVAFDAAGNVGLPADGTDEEDAE